MADFYWYNNASFQSASQCTPFEVEYGRAPPSIARFILRETQVEVVAQDLMGRDEALKQLKHHLGQAQTQMVQYANAHRRISKIQPGD